MSKTTEYQIVESSEADRLVPLVQSAIKQGWEPIGGVAVALGGSEYPDVWAQAMIRTPSSFTPLPRK